VTNTALRYHIPATGRSRVYQDGPDRPLGAYPGKVTGVSARALYAAPVPEDAAPEEIVPPNTRPANTAPEPADTAPERAGAAGIVGLYGLLAYAELVAFFRLSDDGKLAPTLADKAALAGMAVAEFSHFDRIRSELERLGADPSGAMAPFTAPLDAFHARTVPSDWLEGLVKAYVGDGMAADFYRAVAQVLDPGPRAMVLEVLADTGHAQFAVDHVRAAIAADPRVGGRLALWARRLVGEALSQAQRVIAEHPPLTDLLVGNGESQLGEMGRMLASLTDEHTRRMSALGLSD
jgi:hypothetical protein